MDGPLASAAEAAERRRVKLASATVQQRQAADPVSSVWVSASAGTGKTKVLTDRVLALLLAGAAPERLLCLTFTRAAAAEMQGRLARRLTEWVALPDMKLREAVQALTGQIPDEAAVAHARSLFARVLDVPGGMKIQTIHSFCQSLLARFPIEADVAPHFELMDELTARELLEEAKAEVLARAAEDTEGALGRALAAVGTWVDEQGFAELLNALLVQQRARLTAARAAHLGIEGLVRQVRTRLGLAEGETAETILAAACGDPALDEASLRAVCAAMLDSGKKTDAEAGRKIAAWLEAVESRPARWEAYLSAFFTQAGEPRKTLCTKGVTEALPGAEEILAAEAERLDLARGRINAATTAETTAGLLRLGGAVLDAYEAGKRRRARLDYEDLIRISRDLLETRNIAPWVLFKLDGGLDHLLIDEAQDTNPDQWKLVELLTEEFFAGVGAREPEAGEPPRSVFAVGDPKQSIYSFQGADPQEFLRMRAHFAGRVRAVERGWAQVDLAHSFRSVAPVLAAVDAVFERQEQLSRGVAFDPVWRGHDPVRVGQGGRVELWPPAVPDERPEPEAWSPPLDRSAEAAPRARLAELIAETIRRWTTARDARPGDEAWLDSRARPIRAGDVLVLVRRRNAFVEELIRALKQRGVAVAGIDRMQLTEQLAVQDLVALARVCLLPEDDLTLACALKSPLVGLSEEQLFELAYGREGHLWSALEAKATGDPAGDPGADPAADPAFGAAHAFLQRCRDRADLVPPYEFFAELLGAEGGRVKLLGRLGPDAADPIEEFLNLALAYESEHRPSLEGFLHWLERGGLEIKRDADVEGQAVRVMTVHGAKGLQAPIVFLPDTMQVPTSGERLVWAPAEGAAAPPLPLWSPRREVEDAVTARHRRAAEALREQEYWRLLYVALTRAEDRLYLCGYETQKKPPESCWYKLCEAAWQELGEEVAFDFSAVTPGGWSGPGRRIQAPQVAEAQPETAPERPLLAELEAALPAWTRRAPPAEPSPPRPLAPSRPSSDEPALRSPLGEGEAGQVRFARGRLVHRLLQSLPDLAPGSRLAAARRFLSAEAHGLPPEQVESLAAEVLAVLETPDFAPLFGPGSVAEAPLVGLIEGPDGPEAVSGQVDRLCVQADKVLVVDFKTNRPPPESVAGVAPVYLRQMALYCAVLARIYPDRPVEAALLWTDGPRLMPLPGAALAPYAVQPSAAPSAS
jgi:ATP-dependent helicase/nuclease subunit A